MSNSNVNVLSFQSTDTQLTKAKRHQLTVQVRNIRDAMMRAGSGSAGRQDATRGQRRQRDEKAKYTACITGGELLKLKPSELAEAIKRECVSANGAWGVGFAYLSAFGSAFRQRLSSTQKALYDKLFEGEAMHKCAHFWYEKGMEMRTRAMGHADTIYGAIADSSVMDDRDEAFDENSMSGLIFEPFTTRYENDEGGVEYLKATYEEVIERFENEAQFYAWNRAHEVSINAWASMPVRTFLLDKLNKERNGSRFVDPSSLGKGEGRGGWAIQAMVALRSWLAAYERRREYAEGWMNRVNGLADELGDVSRSHEAINAGSGARAEDDREEAQRQLDEMDMLAADAAMIVDQYEQCFRWIKLEDPISTATFFFSGSMKPEPEQEELSGEEAALKPQRRRPIAELLEDPLVQMIEPTEENKLWIIASYGDFDHAVKVEGLVNDARRVERTSARSEEAMKRVDAYAAMGEDRGVVDSDDLLAGF